MKALLTAVKTIIANNSTCQTFMGIGGPYVLALPQPTPAYPYVLISQMSGTTNWQGFGSTYVARPHLRFGVWDRDQDVCITHTEFLANLLDVTSNWSISNGEQCRLPIRIEEPRFLPAQVDVNGILVFGGILDYRFNVQRTRGV